MHVVCGVWSVFCGGWWRGPHLPHVDALTDVLWRHLYVWLIIVPLPKRYAVRVLQVLHEGHGAAQLDLLPGGLRQLSGKAWGPRIAVGKGQHNREGGWRWWQRRYRCVDRIIVVHGSFCKVRRFRLRLFFWVLVLTVREDGVSRGLINSYRSIGSGGIGSLDLPRRGAGRGVGSSVSQNFWG